MANSAARGAQIAAELDSEDGEQGTLMDSVSAEWKKGLPAQDHMLRHAASMPATYDMFARRPCCDGMWKSQQAVGFLLGVLMLLLPILAPPVSHYPQANPMLGITLLCGCFWIFEVLPIYATAMIPVVLMPFFTITDSANAAKAYWQPVQMLVVGTYLVDIALMQVNLPKRFALWLLVSMKTFSPGRLLFCFMLGAWTLSIFVNNIAVALLLTPFATGMVAAAQEEVLEFEFESESVGSDDEREALASEVQNFDRALMLGIAFAANAGGLSTLTGCIPNEVLMGVPRIQEALNYRQWMELAIPVSALAFVVCFVVIYMRYLCGSALKGMSMDALRRERQTFLNRAGPVSRDEILVAFIGMLQVACLWMRPTISGSLPGPQGQLYIGDESIALMCALLLFLVPSRVEPGRSALQWQNVQEHFNFGILMLIGGGFAISFGFEQSGLNIALAHDLAPRLKMHSGLTETFVVLSISMVATQIFSSVAASTVLVPAMHSVALNTMESPLAYLLPATVGCSFGICLPSSAPPNVIVMAKSADLRARDFILTGLQVAAVVLVIASVLVGLLENPIFAANAPFPAWACDEVSCMWVPVPGIVEGFEVTSQGCGLLDYTNGTMCKLWNGTQLSTMPFLDVSLQAKLNP